ncbi:unnamed protein product [Didymodactylos carnosus]|uniref:Uncharacterized protein n=1 Tax=Didymodactylos carnosus TaxID=1234261 RepID=A0A813VZ94_9BILA|nr:unnamed protein product [Didymodactylos carnosus]CAF3635328.1 unnamed protein product [Didymodactylos carnosus]
MTEVNLKRSSSNTWLMILKPIVQRRINALLNLQADYFRVRVKFYEKLHTIQQKYFPEFEHLYQKRCSIINGQYEPSEYESRVDWSTMTSTKQESDSIISIEKKFDQMSTNTSLYSEINCVENTEKGIPKFWLTILKMMDAFNYNVKSQDEPALEHLVDIRYQSSTDFKAPGYTLEFLFSSNKYFTNSILTKQYDIRVNIDETKPYHYEGPEVVNCKGCVINWNSEHDLTIKMRKKRVRERKTGVMRTIIIKEKIKSFFNFFDPPIIPEGGIYDMEEEEQMILEADFEFGIMLKQKILPRAVLYYTGDIKNFLDEEFDQDQSNNQEDRSPTSTSSSSQ